MSALGQEQSFAPTQPNVRFAPKADIQQPAIAHPARYGAEVSWPNANTIRAARSWRYGPSLQIPNLPELHGEARAQNHPQQQVLVPAESRGDWALEDDAQATSPFTCGSAAFDQYSV
jgi:hypothetical protein